jgi:hypothetical protein
MRSIFLFRDVPKASPIVFGMGKVALRAKKENKSVYIVASLWSFRTSLLGSRPFPATLFATVSFWIRPAIT